MHYPHWIIAFCEYDYQENYWNQVHQSERYYSLLNPLTP